jgi:hypothetical protein
MLMETSREFSMERVTFLPNLLPGEHLLGAFSRLLLLNNAASTDELQLSLTGHNLSLNVSAAYHKSYDSLFELFEQQKSREEILNQHTLMGFYRHSMKYQRRHELLISNKYQEREPFYFPGTNVFKNTRLWRWCLSCTAEDSHKYGVPHWHVRHQLPTSLTCPRHTNEHLQSGCNNCGFQIYDLKSCALPPNKQCPVCKFKFETTLRKLSSDACWIQNAGTSLFESESGFLRPDFEWVMHWAVDLVSARTWKLGRSGINKWSTFDKQQKIFIKWLVDKKLDEYFAEGIDLSICKALDIEKTKESPRQVPSLIHLLWLRFLGVQSLRDARRNGFVRPTASA